MLLNCGVGEDSWESLELQGDSASPSYKKSVLNIHWKDWCWSWNSSTLTTWCEELTHLKRPWCGERLRAEGEGDDRGRDGWMASPTWWTWVWGSSRSWCWTEKPSVLQSMGSQRVRHDWATELNWPPKHILIFQALLSSHDKHLPTPGEVFLLCPVHPNSRAMNKRRFHFHTSESLFFLPEFIFRSQLPPPVFSNNSL